MYDLIIIGAGPGGYQAAIRAAQFGSNIALIEKNKIGGTCSNLGCIPAKALLFSAAFLDDIKKSENLGIHLSGIEFKFEEAVDRKNIVVKDLRDGIETLLEKRKVDVLRGFGRIESGNIQDGFWISYSQAGGEKHSIQGKRIIIATGSSPALIPEFNVDHEKILNSDDILSSDFKNLPKSMIIIGGGIIGTEMAYLFSGFGVKITILEYLPTILATEEKNIIKLLIKKLVKMGIDIKTKQNVLKIERTENGIRVLSRDTFANQNEQKENVTHEFRAEICLVSIGRTQNSKNLGLENIGISLKRKTVPVNHDTMETSIPGIYAIGDINDTGMMFAHVATYEGFIAVANALSSIGGFEIESMKTDYSSVPYTIFTHPEIGSVGLREKAAKLMMKEIGTKLHRGTFHYSSLGKARCMNIEEGFLSILTDSKDRILGASCIGFSAAELIAEITLAMKYGITAKQIGETIHSHPTISEMVYETAEDVHGMSIHKFNRRRK